ncbi:Protein TIFY 4B like [Actinidia chinensis var. chinensis]|uniref:Protein TIFY n=1 Tax=Actinidia chinensis var. chinensis TaxID=1590841 RepID=A0A2R6QE23_ACTCC|nr:Protein TIFY 4B like [Actinidia chinensis var. chinensis]
MSTEETILRSPLDKPLHQLTEEDISQLTREDCRRYLKEKGMRRPSWNKSQAIQQVISLKTLLETTPDSDTGARKKLYIPRPENLHRVHKSASADPPICVPAEESAPCRIKDPEKRELSGDRLIVDGNDSNPPRPAGAAKSPLGQMTIFYCGKVNVYDDVPAEKAQELMQLAASPLQLPVEVPFDETMGRRSLPCHLQAARSRVGPDSHVVILPTLQAVNTTDNCQLQREESGTFREDNPAEVPGSRKASVQRYLEKRKDRFKSKRKVATSSSASLDIYLNPQMGNQTQNERSNRTDICFSPQIRPPNTPTRSSSAEDNIVKNANLSTGMNDRDMQE